MAAGQLPSFEPTDGVFITWLLYEIASPGMIFNSEILKRCWFLAGPTAVGKSAVSLALAEQIDAEIISMDSMAVYRCMDLGTAKPSFHERERIAHHVIDVVDPHEEFSVAEYVKLAQLAATAIVDRGRTPLFVGGTGLYLRSILRGVFEGPEADWQLRGELQQQLERHGRPWLHQQLAAMDDVTAQRLHINDTRRVIRAIEVYRLTGIPLSQQHDQSPVAINERSKAIFWLEPPRDWLHDRVNRRVDQMMADGLLEETRQLLAMTPEPARTARQALGYRELIAHLEGSMSIESAVDQIKTGTRQFAKRQHTWFRNLEECTSIPLTGHQSPDQLVEALVFAADK